LRRRNCRRGWQGRSSEAPDQATEFVPPRALPTIALVDQDGKPLDAAFFTRGWTLVFFGFTRCPDVCPTTLATLAQTRATLTDLPTGQQPRVLLVSVDPEHDQASLLADCPSLRPSFTATDHAVATVAPASAYQGGPGPRRVYRRPRCGIFFVAPDGMAAYPSAPRRAVLARDYQRISRGTGQTR
jgi:hypothetical protein